MQRRVLSGWTHLNCSKLGSCHHDTGHVYVMSYPQALPPRSRGLMSVAGLEPGVVHALGRLPLCGWLRIRGLCDSLLSWWDSPQMYGSTLLMAGTWWSWGRLARLPFFFPWALSTAPQSSWSPRSTIFWQWWCLFWWSHSIVLCHTQWGVASGTLIQRWRVVLVSFTRVLRLARGTGSYIPGVGDCVQCSMPCSLAPT